jgi:3-hydroxyacyl-[acyl-carrier-protein] dehydratase
VLIVEALAQAGAVTALSHPDNSGKLLLFAGIDKVRFKRVVVPGDVLDLKVEVRMARSAVGRGKAVATVGGDLACRGELMFAMTDAAEVAAGAARLSPAPPDHGPGAGRGR